MLRSRKASFCHICSSQTVTLVRLLFTNYVSVTHGDIYILLGTVVKYYADNNSNKQNTDFRLIRPSHTMRQSKEFNLFVSVNTSTHDIGAFSGMYPIKDMEMCCNMLIPSVNKEVHIVGPTGVNFYGTSPYGSNDH